LEECARRVGVCGVCGVCGVPPRPHSTPGPHRLICKGGPFGGHQLYSVSRCSAGQNKVGAGPAQGAGKRKTLHSHGTTFSFPRPGRRLPIDQLSCSHDLGAVFPGCGSFSHDLGAVFLTGPRSSFSQFSFFSRFPPFFPFPRPFSRPEWLARSVQGFNAIESARHQPVRTQKRRS
jgi:hypothetical protein